MSDIVTSRVFVDGEKGITAAKLNDIVASSVIQPAFYTSKPTAGTADPADIALILKSGAYTQVPVGTLAGNVTQSQIWSTRLRSFNSAGNPNFEVDMRQAGSSPANPATGAFAQDRWMIVKSAGLTSTVTSSPQPGLVLLPGTSFAISNTCRRFTVGTAQASMAPGDFYSFRQSVEGPNWRELSSDVHSISLLVRSSLPNLSFSVGLEDNTATHSLVKLCTLGAANTWTLVQCPNLPVWQGSFSAAPGQIAYFLQICLAIGTTFSGAPDTWQNANLIGAVGTTNILASAGATFDIAFVQHEPGAVCSTFIDKPFTQNLDECQRYYTKSYAYGVKAGTASANDGLQYFTAIAGFGPVFPISFKKTMAKIPTVLGYAYDGTINNLRDVTAGFNKAITSPNFPGDSGFSGFAITGPNAATWTGQFHYTADSGW